MRYLCVVFLCLVAVADNAKGDGNETFDNENAPEADYADGSFIGNDGVTWNYVQSRSGSADGGAYEINGPGIMLRRSSDNSKLFSQTLSGGIANFSINLKKGFTGGGLRQVELFINGVSKGLSDSFDDTLTHPFVVNGIDVLGDVVIEIRNVTAKQVILDDLIWTTLSVDDPNILVSSPLDFGEIDAGTQATQFWPIVNSGTSATLNVTSFTAVSGDTARFSSLTPLPLNIPPNGATSVLELVYSPGAAMEASHSAVFNLINNDPSDGTKVLTLSGMTLPDLMTISNIQYTSSGTGVSPFDGQVIETRGVTTYVDAQGYVLADVQGGAWGAIYVLDPYHRPNIGDEVRVEAPVNEYQNLTRLETATVYTVLSTSNALPAPVLLTANNVSQEKYECVLVCVSNVTVGNEYVTPTTWQLNDDVSGSCRVNHDIARLLYRYIPQNGNALDGVCGIVWQAGSTYRLQVRDDDDFHGRPILHYALKGLVMTPDGPKTNWYVEVKDDDIVTVGAVAPTGVAIHDTGSIIFPGLIDAHNHPSWNSFPTLQFNNAPYGHRDEWGQSEPEYNDWKNKRNQVRTHSDVLASTKYTIEKYAEILELMAGCVAIQGNHNNMEYTHPDSGIYNVEEFPSRIETDIFPWTMTSTERSELLKKIQGGAVNSFLMHLSEGSDETARAQFDTWENWGMLNHACAIIHGAPYTATEFSKIAAAGAKLIWSPKSNMKLYESTVNVPLAKSLGVIIGLSPDWTASGSYNILEELGYAWQLNQSQFGGSCTPREMCDMVTINNAIACGLDHRYGKILPGYNAGLAIIDGDWSAPYMALINSRPSDVRLTIVDGTPRYGDPDLMTAFGVVGETINAWGTLKKLNLVDDHPFLTYENESLADLISHLTTAHNTLTPQNELDSEELQFLSLALIQVGPDNVLPFHADNPLSAPPSGSTYTIDQPVSLTFRNQDFWDNDTCHNELIHTEVAIVPATQPDQVLQVVAQNLLNENTNETINFTIDFPGLHTNYHYRFLTTDLNGNTRTTVVDTVTLHVNPAAYDMDNDDLLDNWEQQIINANTGDGITSIEDVLPGADYDSDGFTEIQESIAGTAPTNFASRLEVENIEATPSMSGATLQWPSFSNRVYALYSSTNLIQGEYQLVESGINATPPLNTFTNTSTSEEYIFYTISVE